MATAKLLTPDDFDARAAALAVEHHLEDGAEYVRREYAAHDSDGNGIDGTDTYAVPSASEPGTVHHVEHHVRSHTLRCDCKAAQLGGRPCGHVGSVRLELSRRGIALQAWCEATGWEDVRR